MVPKPAKPPLVVYSPIEIDALLLLMKVKFATAPVVDVPPQPTDEAPEYPPMDCDAGGGAVVVCTGFGVVVCGAGVVGGGV
jgi:hypothetical protein